MQAILAPRARSGAPAPPGPAAAPLGPLRDREPVAAPDVPGQRAIAVLTLAVAPVKQAPPGVRLGPTGEGACRPPASRGERAEGTQRLYVRMGFAQTGERTLPEDVNPTREYRFERPV